MEPLKVFDTYFGGKGGDGVYQAIINQIPPHDVKIIPFLGNCAVSRFILPADLNIYIEKDKQVTERWSKAQPERVVLITGDCLKALKGLVFGIDKFDPWKFSSNLNNLLGSLGTRHKTTPGDDFFIYLDPPYLPETRQSDHKYKHELTRKQHEDLLSLILKVPCMVAISCYDNDLYREKLKGWRKIQFTGRTRGRTVTVTLYMNYPEPVELHDYSFLGSDYRERERIKRKLKRHKESLLALPALERAALLRELNEAARRAEATPETLVLIVTPKPVVPAMASTAKKNGAARYAKQTDLVEVIKEINSEKKSLRSLLNLD